MRRAVDILLNDTPQPSNNTWHTSFAMALRTHLYAFSIVLTLTLLRRKERGTLWFKILWWTGGRSVRLSIFLDQSFASYHKNLFACLSHTETYGATSVISSWRHKKIEMKYQWRGCHIYIKLYTRHSAKSKTIPFKETFSVTYWRGRVDCTIFTILYVCVARNESERAAHPAWQICVRSFVSLFTTRDRIIKWQC